MNIKKILFSLLFFVFIFGWGENFDSLKDPDVLYFPGKAQALPAVRLVKLTPLFTEKDLRSLLRNLNAGTSVRVIGWHQQGWLIQSIDSANHWEGWVASDAIQGIGEKELKEYRDKNESIKEFQRAVQEKNIIPGMTEEDVRKALGKPKKTSFRVDEKGKTQTWSYPRYEEVPEVRSVIDAYGRLVQITTMVRVARGETTVEFKEGKVVAYEEKK